jgi:hypothetical protein
MVPLRRSTCSQRRSRTSRLTHGGVECHQEDRAERLFRRFEEPAEHLLVDDHAPDVGLPEKPRRGDGIVAERAESDRVVQHALEELDLPVQRGRARWPAPLRLLG